MAAAAKNKALLYLLLVVLMTVLLGAALPRLTFQPGMPLPRLERGNVVAPPDEGEPDIGLPVSAFARILLFIILALFILNLVYRMLRDLNWRTLPSQLLKLLVLLVVTAGLLILILSVLPKSPASIEAMPLPEPPPFSTGPLGPVPSLLLWLVGLGLFGGILLLAFWIIGSNREPEREPWELRADEARQALLAGGDLKDVILRCYERMSQALAEEQQIERAASMTTGEFERLLMAKGVPSDPVHQLTRLFDAVRYGRWQPSPGDQERAIASLNAVLEFAHAARQAS